MPEREDLEVLSLTTTVGSLAHAEALAARLLEASLVACVQIEPGLQSHYRWEGRLCQEPEVRLTLKTLPEAQAAVEALLVEHHPYDLPQVLSCRMQASTAYAQWVRDEVRLPAAPD